MISEDIAHDCGPGCTGATCPEYPLDFAMFYSVAPLSAQESAAAKAERYAASRRASQAYYGELNRSGSREHAKFAARYAAAGQALTCKARTDLAVSPFWTIDNGEHTSGWSDSTGPQFDGGTSCGRGFKPERRALCHGRALANRRPGARHGWDFSWPSEAQQETAVYVYTRPIDGTDYCVFRVGSGQYMAQTEAMTRVPMESTGECSAPGPESCKQDGEQRSQQLVLVWVAAEKCA